MTANSWRTLSAALACLLPLVAGAGQRVNVRVHAEYIALPHETLTALLQGENATDDHALHKKVHALVAKKEARILETCVVTCLSGERCSLNSIMEFIYPTEADFGVFPSQFGTANIRDPGSLPSLPVFPRSSPAAFETRNTGLSFEVEAIVSEEQDQISLALSTELVDVLRLVEWQKITDRWGVSGWTFPAFETLEKSGGATVAPGRFALLGAFSPRRKGEGGADPKKKNLLFVKATIVAGKK